MARQKKKLKKKTKAAISKAKHHEFPRALEADVIRNLNEDLMDAWVKLRQFAAELGEQRIYASEKAIMFSKRICYFFVRPKKSYIEVCFFLRHKIDDPLRLKIQTQSKTKVAHSFRLIHPDQVEEPLTDWIRESFETVN